MSIGCLVEPCLGSGFGFQSNATFGAKQASLSAPVPARLGSVPPRPYTCLGDAGVRVRVITEAVGFGLKQCADLVRRRLPDPASFSRGDPDLFVRSAQDFRFKPFEELVEVGRGAPLNRHDWDQARP